VKFHQFEKNKMLRSAVERQLLIIGEAAVHISPQFRKKHPEIAWKGLIELRNVIAHEYGETLINRIWVARKKNCLKFLSLWKNYWLSNCWHDGNNWKPSRTEHCRRVFR